MSTRLALERGIRSRDVMIPLVDGISGMPGRVHRVEVAVDTCTDNAGQHTIAAVLFSPSPSQSGKEVLIIIRSHSHHSRKYLYEEGKCRTFKLKRGMNFRQLQQPTFPYGRIRVWWIKAPPRLPSPSPNTTIRR